MKFKVGDKVRFLGTKSIECSLKDAYACYSPLDLHKGDIVTIDAIDDNRIEFKECGWYFGEQDIEPINKNETLIPVNNINELKVGDRVKQTELHLHGENPYATITKIEGSTVYHIHNDGDKGHCDCGGKCFMKVIESTKQEGGARMKVGDRVKFRGRKGGDFIPSWEYSVPDEKIIHGSTMLHKNYDTDYTKVVDT